MSTVPAQLPVCVDIRRVSTARMATEYIYIYVYTSIYVYTECVYIYIYIMYEKA